MNNLKTDITPYLVKQLPQATAFVDAKLKLVFASDKWLALFDFAGQNVNGKSLHQLLGTIDHKQQKILKNCLQGTPGKTYHLQDLDIDHQERWTAWDHIPWYDDKENIIGVILQTTDVTKTFTQEQQLKKLEGQLTDISEISQVGLWEYCAEKQSLFWCDISKKIHEVPKTYKPQLESAINFYKEGFSRNTISMVVYKAMENGTPWREKLQLITKKGNEKWVIAAGKPIYKNNKIIGITGTLQDIDDQVASETKTKESERLLKTVIHNLPLNVFIKDRESRKILVNKSEYEFLGFDNPQSVLGKSDFAFYDKQTAQDSRDEELHIMKSLKPMLNKEVINIKKDGTSTALLTSKIPLMGEDGSINGIVGFSLDISEMKQKEAELMELININALQNKKLINFAHIVSHNLRSHTSNFSMLLDFLVNERDETEKHRIVNMLIEASDNLLETLENLNTVIDINHNVNLEKEPIKINERIVHLEEDLSGYLKNNNATIINTISDDIHVLAVAPYLDNILVNFITNSIKYKKPEEDPIITLGASKNGKHTIISIADNGLGIDLQKYGDKLFGMYKTFHDRTDARGIGLYITKNQMEAMNGKIITCSEVGKGTTFNLYFDDTIKS